MLIKNLGLLNTRLALIIPFAVSQYNLIVMRTYMQQIPSAIEESAKLDGANDFVILFRIFVPMSKPVIATITLFYAAGQNIPVFELILLKKSGSTFGSFRLTYCAYTTNQRDVLNALAELPAGM